MTELANVQTRHHGQNPSLVKETTNLFKPAGTNLPACRSLMPPSIYKSNILYEEKQAPVPEEEVLPPPVRKHQKKLAGKSAIHQAAFPEYQLYQMDQISLNYKNKVTVSPNAIEQALMIN